MLLAIHQRRSSGDSSRSPSLIGLEEPETALHPAAASVLLSALREAARKTQVVVTSHSPDLLDNPDIDEDTVYAVESRDGLTRIGRLDSAGRDMLRRRLFTPGELLRQDQLKPDEDTIFDVLSDSQLRLFEMPLTQ